MAFLRIYQCWTFLCAVALFPLLLQYQQGNWLCLCLPSSKRQSIDYRWKSLLKWGCVDICSYSAQMLYVPRMHIHMHVVLMCLYNTFLHAGEHAYTCGLCTQRVCFPPAVSSLVGMLLCLHEALSNIIWLRHQVPLHKIHATPAKLLWPMQTNQPINELYFSSHFTLYKESSVLGGDVRGCLFPILQLAVLQTEDGEPAISLLLLDSKWMHPILIDLLDTR